MRESCCHLWRAAPTGPVVTGPVLERRGSQQGPKCTWSARPLVCRHQFELECVGHLMPPPVPLSQAEPGPVWDFSGYPAMNLGVGGRRSFGYIIKVASKRREAFCARAPAICQLHGAKLADLRGLSVVCLSPSSSLALYLNRREGQTESTRMIYILATVESGTAYVATA